MIGGVVVASVERTAYPRFKRIISDRELAHFFTPDEAEIAWAAKRTHDRPESFLTLLVLLKSCARLGYFRPIWRCSAPTGARTYSASATTPPTNSTYPRPPQHQRGVVSSQIDQGASPGAVSVVEGWQA
ncbi:DUF4158 domain-containing protein [Streptomyces sp. NPDC060002]|uniref:DUF4158 domain-containing protein n=1 Tax=Streptomyces sp. NPDC060002 TaxID=3347033 RepID=UPI0036C0752F